MSECKVWIIPLTYIFYNYPLENVVFNQDVFSEVIMPFIFMTFPVEFVRSKTNSWKWKVWFLFVLSFKLHNFCMTIAPLLCTLAGSVPQFTHAFPYNPLDSREP